jgi:putative pyruvate formate lyase activating enzyme
MQRQVGELKLDEQGLARRGVLLRHLVLPGSLAGTAEITRFLAREISLDTYVNIMAQYVPAGRVSAEKLPELNLASHRRNIRMHFRLPGRQGCIVSLKIKTAIKKKP